MRGDELRPIIDELAYLIKQRSVKSTGPKADVIYFRTDIVNKREREVYDVPLELLRYRKDNGRIISDVLSYEKQNNLQLDEKEESAQKVLLQFLREKDPEKTKTLKNSIKKQGQIEPVIITCDGFLINGNRRRMVLEELKQEDPSKYTTMRAIILPGKSDPEEGGPPTIQEIELLENRYQFQKDGKSDYTNLDRALSIRRKEGIGISLEVQLRDDSDYAHLSEKEFNKIIKKYKDDFLEPLDLIDEYLNDLNRSGEYSSISKGPNDKDGRWQAFLDLSNFYNKTLKDDKKRNEINVEEIEIGEIKANCFKIIRKKRINGINKKLHDIMRDMPKLLKNPESKQKLALLDNIDFSEFGAKDHINETNAEVDFKELDNKWSGKYGSKFQSSLIPAYDFLSKKGEELRPLDIIEQVLNKLEKIDVTNIKNDDINKFCTTAGNVVKLADSLKKEVWEMKRKGR